MRLEKRLIKGSVILLITFGVFNVLNFAFHFFMARQLTVEDYGILATLFSIIYILSIFSESIQTVIVKFTTGENDNGRLKNILKKSLRKSSYFSFFIFAFYLIICIPLAPLLKIEYPLMALNGLIIFFIFLAPVTRGIIQGGKKFRSLGVNMIAESSLKLISSVLFVYLGFRVFGAIGGVIIGCLAGFGLSFLSLKEVMCAKEKQSETGGIYEYTAPVFFMVLFLFAFFGLDVVIAKIFFSEKLAGAYAISSILAKTIFFGTHPISRAMFPLIAEKEKKDRSRNVLFNAFVILTIIVATALVLFYFASGFLVSLFSGGEIKESAEILFSLGVATSLLAYTNLVILYKLSIGKTKRYPLLGLFVLFELILLSCFTQSLLHFSIAFAVASAAFLLGSVILLDK